MAMTVTLHGFRYSVYVRIARMTLAEKGVAYDRVEVNPFSSQVPMEYLALHPFGRVPTLVHGDFTLYETCAITRYVDEAFDGPALQPRGVRARARMTQIISIIDSYGYVPMVRQVFSERVFGPATGRTADEAIVRQGLEKSLRALTALEALAGDAGPLTGDWSLADFHLAPMVAYFTAAPEGRDMLARFSRLSAWWEQVRTRQSFIDTEPGLPRRA
jgi:glutathione S-transferase